MTELKYSSKGEDPFCLTQTDRFFAQSNGVHFGPVPLGYQRDYYNGRILPNTSGQQLLPQIYAWRIAGETTTKIALILNTMAIPAPRTGSWTRHKVNKLLTRQIHRGRSQARRDPGYMLDDDEYLLVHTPWTRIVSDEVWAQAQPN